jgi:hypothetical protein
VAVKLTSPKPNEVFDLDDPVKFEGTADGGVKKVEIVADDQFALGTVTVESGKWTFSRVFHTPGKRKITAKGLKDGGGAASIAETTIILQTPSASCEFRQGVFTIGGKMVFTLPGSPALFFRSGMTIDADGAYHAYHPDNVSGLDNLQNAKDKNGNFVGVVLGANGKPVVQKAGDPAPGFFVSSTSLVDSAVKEKGNPLRYVNSETVPYFVLAGAEPMRNRVTLGDFGVVFNGKNGKLVFAIYADVGPSKKLGEGSIALAKALGINPSPRHGGTDGGILYVVFPGSRKEFGKSWSSQETVQDIEEQAGKHFATWGGMARISACFQDLAS